MNMNSNAEPQPQSGPSVPSTALLSDSPTWPIVFDFAKRMEAKLAKNRHKGDREGWIYDDPEALLRRLGEETQELWTELHIGFVRMNEPLNASAFAERIANEAADVANFAMMIADWHLYRVRQGVG